MSEEQILKQMAVIATTQHDITENDTTWLSKNQLAKKLKIAPCKVQKSIQAWIEAGLIEEKEMRVLHNKGYVVRRKRIRLLVSK